MPAEAVETKKMFLGRCVEAFLMIPIIISNELVGILGVEKRKSCTNWTDNDVYIANSIGQLAAGIAHEINNPQGYIISNNTALKGYMKKTYDILMYYKELLEQLEEHPDPELRKKAAEIKEMEHDRKLDFIKDDIMAVMADVEEGLDRISKRVKGLWFVSHRVMDDELEEYDLNQGIQNTIVVARNEIKYYAEVKEILGDIPLIYAIGGQINQVLLNLIINSVHAIKEKNPEENMKRLFAPFFTTKPAGLGTGLGLAMKYYSREQFRRRHEVYISITYKTNPSR